MVFGDLQFFDIIIFAGIAIFLVYRLKKILGKKAKVTIPKDTQIKWRDISD